MLLSGRKGSIASLIGFIIAYLATKGVLGPAEVALASGFSLVFFGVASYKTSKMYNK